MSTQLTRCTNEKCAFVDYCKRQEFSPTIKQYGQSAFRFVTELDKKCEFFVPNEKYETFRILSTT